MENRITLSRFGFILAVCTLGAVASPASAEETTPAAADISCLLAPAKMDDAGLQSFIANPKALLSENQSGGLPLANRVRQLAASSSHAFTKIIELAKDANAEQKSAIAAGLARAVSACANVGGDLAADYGSLIQTGVASLGDQAFAAAFLQASNDVKVASVGPGSAGFSLGGGATDDTVAQESGINGYRSSGDGPLDTTSAKYTIGHVDPFGARAKITSPSGS